MPTAVIAVPAECSSATASMLTHRKGGVPQPPNSPASDAPDSPMPSRALSSTSRPPPPPKLLELEPSVQADPYNTATDELDTTDAAAVACPVHVTSASARPTGARRRGVRWPARRGATAGVLPSPRVAAVPLPEPAGLMRAPVPEARRNTSGAKSIRWPKRRGASAGLGHTIVASQYNVIEVPRTP